MKILGNDGKYYATVKEAKEADERFEEEQKALEAKKDAEIKSVSNQKKELSNKIEAATKKYETAQEKYEELKKEAENMLREANKKAYNILLEGAREIEKASNERMTLIKEFNEKFERPFTKFYTGKDAEEQYSKILKQFSDFFDFPFNLF